MNQEQFFNNTPMGTFPSPLNSSAVLSNLSFTSMMETISELDEIKLMIEIQKACPKPNYYEICMKMTTYQPKVYEKIYLHLKKNMPKDDFSILCQTLYKTREEQLHNFHVDEW
jgi:hypothetical protein